MRLAGELAGQKAGQLLGQLTGQLVGQARVAHVGGARERRSMKGQGLLRKEGPPTYAILSRAFNEGHFAFVELSTKAILLS